MRRLLLVLIATLAIVPTAHAWTWPADGRILAPFAFDPGNPYAAGQHRGIDVAGGPAAAVRAPAAGVVSFAGSVPGSGKTITIETADGWSVTLTHLGQLGVKKDAAVAEGDPVGALADGSGGDEPYVQLGIRRTADPQGYVDPLDFLPARQAPVPAPPAAASPADATPVPATAAAPAAPVVAAAPAAPVVAAAPAAPVVAAAPAAPVVAAAPLPADPPPAAAAPPLAVAMPPAADSAPAVAPTPAPVALDPQPAPAPAPAAAALAPAPVAAPSRAPAPAPPVSAHAGQPPQPRAAPSPAAVAPPRSALAAVAPPRSALAAVVRETPLVAEPSRPPDALARPLAAATRPLSVSDARRSPADAPKRAPAPPRVSRPHPSIAHGFEFFGVVAALLAGLAGVLLAARRAAAAPAREPAVTGLAAQDSYIHFDALLLDDPDLLREQHASHRACLHDLRRRHPRPPSEAARRRDLLPHRRRRARDEGVQGRAGAGPHGAGVRRLDRTDLARPGATVERAPRLLHQDER
jgi:hypothetical protein